MFPSSPSVRVDREREESKREDGTGVCRDQCMVHTDDLSHRQGCRQEKARVSGGKEREGGRKSV